MVCVGRVDLKRNDRGNPEPVLRTHAIQGIASCGDRRVVLRGRGDAKLQLPLSSWHEGEAHAHVFGGPRRNPGADLPACLGNHAIGHDEADVEPVRFVAVVADFEFHGLGRVAGNVGLVCVFIKNGHGRSVQNLNSNLKGLPHRVVGHVSSNGRCGVEARLEAQRHVEPERDVCLTVPSVQHRGLLGKQFGLKPPIGLLQFNGVLFLSVSGVDERQRNHTSLAVGGAADLVLLGGERQRAEHRHLDVAHEHIGAEQGATACGACCAEVEGDRSWRGELVGGHVEVQIHGFTLAERNRQRHDCAGLVDHQTGPVGF